MAYDLEEQESIDEMKAWWEKWGNTITTLVTIGCLAFAGVNGWKWYQNKQAVEAQGIYAQLMAAIAQHDRANVESLTSGLQADYGTTVFATLGALQGAAALEAEKAYPEAAAKLTWVVDKSDYAEFKTVARLRLAGLLMEEKQFDRALAVLKAAQPTPSEKALIEDRLGDVYFALGQADEARQAWQNALNDKGASPELLSLISLKLGAVAN